MTEDTKKDEQNPWAGKVKSWDSDSTHGAHAAARTRLEALRAKGYKEPGTHTKPSKDAREAKIKLRANGKFEVRVWTGQMKNAPKPKPKVQNEPAMENTFSTDPEPAAERKSALTP